ncbi:maleylpyruvate isomerase N-terminal domain-containing protein [Actinomadura xylanilytica]|uniref:maleylpyruvate isomerase N-terminal domain-containing protein n=1 Tax=Actinomadura xylanilytica TaxID=887459 RepID=UPI00255AFD1D|nr:maleylpyruvate isomerase N-terminal domain-containing protein [Actinomadura xylanilytica]MDL4777357.1 maleylpyruvate isomerase family mycothiol-dependent enzyme [Actinomadura xylanilytica]
MASTFRVTHDQWLAVRHSLEHTSERFARLAEQVPDTRRTAVDQWSVADTVAHVTGIAEMYTSLVRAEARRPAGVVAELVPATTVDTVDRLNDAMLEGIPDRRIGALTERLRAAVGTVLQTAADADPDRPVPWIGGARVPVAGLLAHLINELLIHGWDIARAARLPWTVPPRDAAAFFELFMVGMTRNGLGRFLDSDEPPRHGRIAVEFRSRYTTPATIVLQDGRATVEEPGPGADVRIFFDPATFNLMLFDRIGKARAVLSGKVVVRGRRPWLLPAFLRVVRTP